MKKVCLYIMQPQAKKKKYLRACSVMHGWKQYCVFLHVTLFTPNFDLRYLLNVTTSFLGIFPEHFFPSLRMDLSILFKVLHAFLVFSDPLESLSNYSWDQGQNQLNITTEIISSGTLVKLLNNLFSRVQINIG